MCSKITYPVTSVCQTFTIWEGCFSTKTCSGIVGVMKNLLSNSALTPTIQPTLLQTYAPVVVSTITLNPQLPAWSGCPFYSTSNTVSATRGISYCAFTACVGDNVIISLITSDAASIIECTGDTYLRLYDSTGAQVAYNDDFSSGNSCSKIIYPVTSSGCQIFTIWEGCYSTGTCSGIVGVTTNPPLPSAAPSPSPPTKIPTATPTIKPTNPGPSQIPTISPSFVPSYVPTVAPTLSPSIIPTKLPTTVPTLTPTATPSAVPSFIPTVSPSFIPTALPTQLPTSQPTSQPTRQPTTQPTTQPTKQPTRQPTGRPT